MKQIKPTDVDLFKTIQWFCEADPDRIYAFADRVFGKGSFVQEGGFYYSGLRHNVLAVGHVDYIPPRDKSLPFVERLASGVRSIALDDRLGIAMLFMLRRLGYEFDLLLTDMEEVGQSTAKDFNLLRSDDLKTYGWIFEIDRRVSSRQPSFTPSVVMYQYHTKALQEMFESLGFVVESGSVSDISYLDDSLCSAFNFCAAYTNEHTDKCYANYDDIRSMLSFIGDFLKKNLHARFVRDLDAEQEYRRENSTFYSWRPYVLTAIGSWSVSASRPSSSADYWDDRSRLGKVNKTQAAYVFTSHPGGLILDQPTNRELTMLYSSSDVVWTTLEPLPRFLCSLTNESLPGVLRICHVYGDSHEDIGEITISEDIFIQNYLT